MVIYLTPDNDEVSEQDMRRMAPFTVRRVVLSFRHQTSVQQAVHLLTGASCKGLVLPDDFHRHNELIEHCKACAHHAGIPVYPVTRYVAQEQQRNAPAPATASVHANAAAAGVGANLLPAAAG